MLHGVVEHFPTHSGVAMKPVVFIHTNDKQMLGAKVGAHLLKARSRTPEHFDVVTLRLEEISHLSCRDGNSYLRKGRFATWRNDDLQSFSPLRMMVPQVMKFQGKALVIDPDVFAVGDVCELLNRDMAGKSILCREVREGYRGNGRRFFASSVMLLDCARLSHWRWNDQIDAMFSMKLDYGPWISLIEEDPATIGEIGEEWNDFDRLTPRTKLLHNTERSTQPWKTGLPVDYDTTGVSNWRAWVGKKLAYFGVSKQTNVYVAHPDSSQERFFLHAVLECLDKGVFEEEFLKDEIEKRHVRADIFDRLNRIRTNPLAA
jgi:hypothetical protein